jgi:hypothetical protein
VRDLVSAATKNGRSIVKKMGGKNMLTEIGAKEMEDVDTRC